MLAAILRRIPTLAFEPNVVPGFANRLVARWVSAAAVHFEETCEYFPQCDSHRCAGAAGFFQIPTKARRPADAAGLRRKPGRARHQPGDDRILARPARKSARPPHHSSDRRARLQDVAAAYQRSRSIAAKFTSSSTTCQACSRAPICWSAAPAPARSQKSRQRASRRSSFRFLAPRTITRT